MTIATNIYNLRQFFELSQTDVAKICEVTVSAVGHWEKGRALPRYKHIIALADYLGIAPETILTEEQFEQIDGTEELIAIYRSMNETGQAALLAAARGMAAAYPKNQGMEQTA